jgi:hypothetical protein
MFGKKDKKQDEQVTQEAMPAIETRPAPKAKPIESKECNCHIGGGSELKPKELHAPTCPVRNA